MKTSKSFNHFIENLKKNNEGSRPDNNLEDTEDNAVEERLNKEEMALKVKKSMEFNRVDDSQESVEITNSNSTDNVIESTKLKTSKVQSYSHCPGSLLSSILIICSLSF